MAHSGAWRGVSEYLNDVLTIHALDMPGHGRSAPYDGVSCTGTLVSEAVLERIQAPVDVIAHSFGAVVALQLAVSHPKIVRSLTLYEPVFFALARGIDLGGFDAHEAMVSRIARAVRSGDHTAAARDFMKQWNDGTPWAAIPKQVRDGFARRIPFVLGSQNYVSLDTPGTLPRLGEITVPCAIMDGVESPPEITSICDGLAERIEGAVRVRVPGAGHMGAISHPATVAQEVTRLIP
ncbi:pimeloyl-ACP methyl ester carboxylesterase [Shimia abyssi]|uniref:Pimeloyl-ACP methyl ester carboxylesterase n=2 Tax=Shimia abyssi TaxID=1662395 RepID=A0A2P8F7H2_9RHOB|nr:alpha/beta hydrolase [Shimia abyssi]PSL17671.1 pimeloyl-ACP methyl ester carboxylesterase [Shimia abyssi]